MAVSHTPIKEVTLMVTYSDLIQLGILIIGIISLCVDIKRNK
jgi:hypothetical protein